MKTITELEEILFRECSIRCTKEDYDIIKETCAVISKYIDNCISKEFKISLYQHNLKTAILLVYELNLESDCIIAALVSNSNFPPEDNEEAINLTKKYSESTLKLIEYYNKVSSLDLVDVESNADSFRKLLINISTDIRVVLIRLLDRLITMREVTCFPEEFQKKLSQEAMYLYGPLAHRMGLYNVYSELSTRAFRQIEPESYKKITEDLNEILIRNKDFLPEFIAPIEKELKKLNIPYQIKHRIKSPYSIRNKMERQKITIEEINDLYAIRIIFDSDVEDEKLLCWQIYAIITDIYPPNINRTRDWISHPRENGYESLHTTVKHTNGVWVEVQIRSKRMDKIAEYGPAAHWLYKGESGKTKSSFEEWLTNIREILEDDVLALGDLVESFKPDTINDEIFVFTPNKEIKRFNSGATLLDFAYEIHSEIGNKCVGGIVNNKHVDKAYKLQNGDIIFIETSKNQFPTVEWLKLVNSTKAKYNIRKSLNEKYLNQANEGKAILRRKLKNWKYDFEENINDIIQYFDYKYGYDFFYDIATSKINTLKVKEFLDNKNTLEEEKAQAQQVVEPQKIKSKNNAYLIMAEDQKRFKPIFANCCDVQPGDNVFGFISTNADIKVHKFSCPNAKHLHERFPYRIIDLKWVYPNK